MDQHDDQDLGSDVPAARSHIDRRKLIVGGAVGGAAVWAAPSVLSMSAAAAATDNNSLNIGPLPPALGLGPYGIAPRPFSVPNMVGATQVLMGGETGAPQAGGQDDVVGTFVLPFPFTFYGVSYGSAWVTSNGRGGFAAPSTAFANAPLVVGDPVFSPYWDDLVIPTDAGIFVKVFDSAPNRAVAIQWRGVRPFGNFALGGTYNFFVILYETLQIDFVYANVVDTGVPGSNNGASATVGVQGGTSFTQHSFDAAVIANGSALRVTG